MRLCASAHCSVWFERRRYPCGTWMPQLFCCESCRAYDKNRRPEVVRAANERLRRRRRARGVQPRKRRESKHLRDRKRQLAAAMAGTSGRGTWKMGYCIECGEPFVTKHHPCEVCSKRCRKRVDRRDRKRTQGNHRRRAKYFGVDYEPVSRMQIFERDGYRCQACGRRCRGDHWKPDGTLNPCAPTLDHIVPMSCGGAHIAENMQTMCAGCNCHKGNRAANDQLRLLGE